MRYVFEKGFTIELKALPKNIQTKFWKQLNFLLNDIRHPSLRTKKYKGIETVWQARVDQNYRFYFLIEKDTYVLVDISPHPD